MTRPLDTLTVAELEALADEPCGYVLDPTMRRLALDAEPVAFVLTADAEAMLRRAELRLVTP